MSNRVQLHAGDDSVTIDVDRGGRLSSWRTGGRERLTQPPPDGDPLRWGSYLMAPWAGRLRDGVLRFGGETHRLERNLGEHAIHGLCFDRPWTLERPISTGVTLSFDLERTTWPFGGRVEQVVSLRPGELHLRAEVVGTRPMPVVLGWHPWFARDAGEDVRIRVPADELLVREGELLPTGVRRPVAGPEDLRTLRPVEGLTLDDAFADVRDAELRWPDLGLEISGGPTITTVVVYVSPGAVCIEPQTGWPDAPNLAAAGRDDSGLVVVEPGRPLVAEQTWRWRRPA